MIFTAKYILGAVATLSIAVGAISASDSNPVCPDDFGTDDAGSAQYLASTDRWTNDFFDKNPDASLTDWANARHQFWIDNHCTAALERYEDIKAGKADPKAVEAVNNVIQEALGAPNH